MFERLFQRCPGLVEEPWFPHAAALELEEKPDEYRVRIDLPGYTSAEIDVEVSDRRLLVRARHDEAAPVSGPCTDELARQIDLPQGIAVDRVTATYAHGELEIILPRERESMRKVEVTAVCEV